MSKSLLQRSAVASGLASQEELDALLAELKGDGSTDNVSDDALGERLVAAGKLNMWQVQQLKNGRTKFTLGNYQVIDSIGRGGMGEVYKAEHTIMGRAVAVKVLPRSRSTPEAIAGFQREIRTLAQLDHENLVRAFDAGHDGSVHFLVTEFVPGTDLRRLVRANGPVSVAQAASIISQAAQGLDHAHGRGLIHRDVKPANLLVTPEGRVKVSDLGLAGYFNDPEQVDQYGGKVVGTADYLAPEAILRPDQLDKRSDLYSLGCTLYYAVTGKVPFPGGTMREKARNHCQTPPLDPRRLTPDLPDEFVEVIADLMEKRPDDRIQSATEVIERLRRWTSNTVKPAAPPLVAEPVAPIPLAMPTRRAAPSPVGDTEPHFLVQPSTEHPGESSVSQASFGTHASAVYDDTIPAVRHRPRSAVRHRDPSAARVRTVLLIGAITVVVILSAVAMFMVYRMVAR